MAADVRTGVASSSSDCVSLRVHGNRIPQQPLAYTEARKKYQDNQKRSRVTIFTNSWPYTKSCQHYPNDAVTFPNVSQTLQIKL